MRRHGKRGRRAALLALAVFVWAGAAAFRQRDSVLTIEVISPQVQQVDVHQEARPKILIYHTHTWESYEMTPEAQYTPTQTWRTMDQAHNMVRIGEELAKELKARGFDVTHDTTAFEPPNLSSAYTRSLTMIQKRMNAGETYEYIFDVHRDAYSGLRNGANGVQKDDVSCAYVMMLVGKGTGQTGSGFDERPDWPQNLALAQAMTDAMNALVPGIALDVKIKSGRFNQHVSSGAVLIEVGNNRNTLQEALNACPVIAEAVRTMHAERTKNGIR